jgi:RNA polymerase sigma-70 factor (ECF subfamily)
MTNYETGEAADAPGQRRELRLRALFDAAQAGDAAAYHAFLSELGALLRGFLRRRLRQLPDEVEDLVQETLIAVHNQRHTYDPALPLTAWLHAIAKYKLIDLLRRRGRREALHDSIDDGAAELLTTADEQDAHARQDVARLLELLPDKQRLPIIHVKIEGLSVAETARLTGLSEPAVKIGVFRGLRTLARLIRQKE